MNKLNVGDNVRFSDMDDQLEYEKEYVIPFQVHSTKKKDVYSSGHPMDSWEDVVSIEDANGEVFAEEIIDDGTLIRLQLPQTEPTVDRCIGLEFGGTEPDKEKSAELKEILLKKITEGDKTPIKMIESISGDRNVRVLHFDFVPYEFVPEYRNRYPDKAHKPVPAFEGSAHVSSCTIDLTTNIREFRLWDVNPIECQTTVFIEHVVNYTL